MLFINHNKDTIIRKYIKYKLIYMGLKELLHSKNGKILMSVLLGIGVSTLFRKVCKERNCLIFKAPKFDKIKDKVYKFNDKCYTYTESLKPCNVSKHIVDFD